MKTKTTLGILAAFTLLVGCATPLRGPAYGHEQELRRQLAESVPVKDWGYRIQEMRFSADYNKALVVFVVPDSTNATEVVLEDDGFGRYAGSVSDLGRMEAGFKAKPVDFAAVLKDSYRKSIILTLPNTRGPTYRLEPEFRRQLTESVPFKDWGYKIQEIRFSGDSHKARVLCLEPGAAKSREFTLEDDGFRRFIGPVTPYDAENKEQWKSTVRVTVTLPDK
jgi:hypothetical protein